MNFLKTRHFCQEQNKAQSIFNESMFVSLSLFSSFRERGREGEREGEEH